MRDLIYTCVSGDYLGYAPLFHLAAARANPNAEVEVDRITTAKVPFQAACQRFLTSNGDYDRVYITDIDMIHLTCCGDLWAHHEAIGKQYGTCYSNTCRRREPLGAQRMTGLHMCLPGWYEATSVSRNEEQEALDRRVIGKGRFDDELMLRRIVERSGLPVLDHPGNLVKRHFGIHMGTIRAYRSHGRAAIWQQLGVRIDRPMAQEFCQIYDSLVAVTDDHTILDELQIIYRYCMERSK